MERYVVGIGANIGDAAATIAAAIGLVEGVVAVSALYASAPVGGPPQQDFLNAAVLVSTPLDPPDLLQALQALERDLGRVRTVRWGPRTVDLDILTWSGGPFVADDLVIPHPRLAERLFAILPLLDVASGDLPDGRSLRSIANGLAQEIRRLGVVPGVTIGPPAPRTRGE